jgi:ComF family protein
MNLITRTKRLSQWLLSSVCLLCGARIRWKSDLCDGCNASLPRLTSCCPRCATPLPDTAGIDIDVPCGQCQQHPPAYAHTHAAFRYGAPVDGLIHGGKYGNRLDWIAALGRRLSMSVASRVDRIDLLVPVPLHYARLRERGYNQSVELARPLAKRFRLPLALAIRRVRATPTQTGLSRDARRRNVRHAFVAKPDDVLGRRIAIIDDVMTSGATADALSRCLRRAGAAYVEVWVVARA